MKKFALSLLFASVILSSCAPTTSQPSDTSASTEPPQSSAQPALTQLPFKAGQTWEMLGLATNPFAEDNVSFTLEEPQTLGDSWVFSDRQKQAVINGVPHRLLGFLYNPQEKILTAAAATDASNGKFCLVTDLSGDPGSMMAGYYYVGKSQDFAAYGKAKDYSKFGVCFLKLK